MHKTLTKIKKRKLSVGAWIQTSSYDNVEIISNSNFDWIAIDQEHGNISNQTLKDLVRVIQGSKNFPFVRLKSRNPEDIPNILDTGVQGIIIPHVRNAIEVKKIVNNCFYHPKNKRGIGFSRANDFGRKLKQYQRNHKNLAIFAMIENKDGYENLNEILSVKEVDGVFIGPYDLSASLNIFEKFNDIGFKKVIRNILDICKKNNKMCGIHIIENNPKELEKRKKEGYKFIAYSLDTFILRNYQI